MRAGGFKTFWISFFLTAAVMVPLIFCTLLWVRLRQDRADRVSQSESGIPIRAPTTQNQHTLLLAVPGADAAPALVLARLDAPGNTLRMAVIPAEGVVLAGQQTLTLAEGYAAAGPARVTQLLEATLKLEIDHYLAVTAADLGEALGQADRLRTGLSGALTTAELAAAGLSAEAADYTARSARALLAELQAMVDAGQLSAASLGRARAALWDALARQQLALLPAALPEGLRQVSGSTLTDLTAQDYYTLAETLEFLANQAAAPTAELLPGQWNAAARRYEFSDETLEYLQAFFSAPAADGASSAASAP